MKTMQRFTKSGLVAALAVVTLAFGVTAANAATTDITWHSATVNAPSDYYASVAYGDGHWIAITNSGALAISTDGATWNAGPATLEGTYFTDITFGNGKFVAIGDRDAAVSSDNGATWTLDTQALSPNYYYHVAFGNGRFVAAEGDNCNGNAAYSTDGLSWTTVSTATTNVCWTNIAFGGGKFVMVSDKGIDVSGDNGATWTNALADSSHGTQAIRSVAYGNGKFIALNYFYSGNPTQVLTSTDGVTWTSADISPSQTSTNYQSLIYAGDRWIAGARYSDIGAISYLVSVDNGATWIASIYNGYGINHLASNGSEVVYVGKYFGPDHPADRTTSPIAYANLPAIGSTPQLAATGGNGVMTTVYGLFGLLLVGAGVMLVRRK